MHKGFLCFVVLVSLIFLFNSTLAHYNPQIQEAKTALPEPLENFESQPFETGAADLTISRVETFIGSPSPATPIILDVFVQNIGTKTIRETYGMSCFLFPPKSPRIIGDITIVEKETIGVKEEKYAGSCGFRVKEPGTYRLHVRVFTSQHELNHNNNYFDANIKIG